MIRMITTALVVFCTSSLLAQTVKTKTETSQPTKTEETEKDKLLQIEKNIILYTNQERKRHGLLPLIMDRHLMKSARNHCVWMTRNRRMQHTSQPVAENIAVGYSSSQSVLRGWMNSSGHRANILGRYRRIGVAAYRTQNGTIYWCQQFK